MHIVHSLYLSWPALNCISLGEHKYKIGFTIDVNLLDYATFICIYTYIKQVITREVDLTLSYCWPRISEGGPTYRLYTYSQHQA